MADVRPDERRVRPAAYLKPGPDLSSSQSRQGLRLPCPSVGAVFAAFKSSFHKP